MGLISLQREWYLVRLPQKNVSLFKRFVSAQGWELLEPSVKQCTNTLSKSAIDFFFKQCLWVHCPDPEQLEALSKCLIRKEIISDATGAPLAYTYKEIRSFLGMIYQSDGFFQKSNRVMEGQAACVCKGRYSGLQGVCASRDGQTVFAVNLPLLGSLSVPVSSSELMLMETGDSRPTSTFNIHKVESPSGCGADWYAVRTIRGKEVEASDRLIRLEVEPYLPLCIVTSEKTARTDTYPLVPNFVFFRATPLQLQEVLKPEFGFVMVRSASRRPLKIPVDQMERFMQICNHLSDNVRVESEELTLGACYRITRGPFKGIEGQITKVGKQTRIIFRMLDSNVSISLRVSKNFLERVK